MNKKTLLQIIPELLFLVCIALIFFLYMPQLAETAVHLADIVGGTPLEEMGQYELFEMSTKKPELDFYINSFSIILAKIIGFFTLSFMLLKGTNWYLTLGKKFKIKNYIITGLLSLVLVFMILILHINMMFFLDNLGITTFFAYFLTITLLSIISYIIFLMHSNLKERSIESYFKNMINQALNKKYLVRYLKLLGIVFLGIIVLFLFSYFSYALALIYLVISYITFSIWSRKYIEKN